MIAWMNEEALKKQLILMICITSHVRDKSFGKKEKQWAFQKLIDLIRL